MNDLDPGVIRNYSVVGVDELLVHSLTGERVPKINCAVDAQPLATTFAGTNCLLVLVVKETHDPSCEWGLTLALSGWLTRSQARGRRNMAGAPDARPRG